MPTLAVIAPHPDDETYPCGGTIALLSRAGWQCTVLFLTSGEAGQRHDGGNPLTLGLDREAEARAACALLGADPSFLRLPDGGLADHPINPLPALDAVRGANLVIAPGPDGAYGHPDHLVAHRWAQEAVPRALIYPVFPRGLFLPQYEKCLAMLGSPPNPPPEAIGTDEFDLAVELSSVHDSKLASIAAHRTQLPGGDPRALFPQGIVDALLGVERFMAATPASRGLAFRALRPWVTG